MNIQDFFLQTNSSGLGPFQILYDENGNGQLTYVGFAPKNVATSAALWWIVKITYAASGNPPHRVLKYQLVPTDLDTSRTDILLDPDLSKVTGTELKYWKVEGTAVLPMTALEMTAADALISSAAQAKEAAVSAQFDQLLFDSTKKSPDTVKTNAYIDSIKTLDDAKTFLKILVSFLSRNVVNK